MKAVIYRAYGAPDEVLEFADVDEPEIAGDQVLIDVHSASVNAADWHFVRGTPYFARLQIGLRTPRVDRLGCDLAGRVVAVGENAAALQPGDDVFASAFMRGFGAFAERIALSESVVARNRATSRSSKLRPCPSPP